MDQSRQSMNLPPPRPPSAEAPVGGVSKSFDAGMSKRSSRPASAPHSRPMSITGRSDPDGKPPKDEPNWLCTDKRTYPIPFPPEKQIKSAPQTADEAERIERVNEKNYMLRQQFMGREKYQRPPSKGEKPFKYKPLPPWWSQVIHGEPGVNIDVNAKLRTHQPLGGIKKSLYALRMALSIMPWPDGRPVQDPERRIRGEIQDMEVWMRNHVSRIVERIYMQAKAPAVTPKIILMRAFQRHDVTRTGDVTVQEFADVWNDPQKGLHLMVPIMRKINEVEMEEVRIKKAFRLADALKMWEKSPEFPLWPMEDPEYRKMEDRSASKRGNLLLRPKEVLVAHAAAFFINYGYDKDGLMPYEVFVNHLFTTPGRLLGMQQIMNQRARGKHGFAEKSEYEFDGKILYQRAKKGVFPPMDFDPKAAERSNFLPSASLKLEHAFGYAGLRNLANNCFYTENGDEIVYYTAALGVVLNTATNTQKFFHGHNNTITALALHPSKWIVATGQQKTTGPTEVPYVCVWETRNVQQLQRLNHPIDKRSICALGFSPDGETLATVTTDNNHSLFLWKWMTDENKMKWILGQKVEPRLIAGWPKTIPGTAYGPQSKLYDLEVNGMFYKPANGTRPLGAPIVVSKKDQYGRDLGPAPTGLKYVPPKDPEAPLPLPEYEPDPKDPEAWMKGFDFELNPREIFGAFTGAPPQVFGIVWNPYSSAGEFITYGVKHVTMWAIDNSTGVPRYGKTMGSFGPTKVDNVLSAAFVRDPMAGYRETIRDMETGKLFNKGHAKVTHSGKVIRFHRDPNDDDKVVVEEYVSNIKPNQVDTAILVTGFPSGEIGVWIQGIMMRCLTAHQKGPKVILPDGACTYAGVRGMKLRATGDTLLTGGADGQIKAWDVRQTVNDMGWMKNIGDVMEITGEGQGLQGFAKQNSRARKDEGSAIKGSSAALTAHSSTRLGRGAVKINQTSVEGKWKLVSPNPKEDPCPAIRSVDSRPGSDDFIAGTNKCDIWLMSATEKPRQLMVGATAVIMSCAWHPRNPHIFASAAESSMVRVWNAEDRVLSRMTSVGFQCRSVAFSSDGSHLAVGGKHGRLRILSSSTLQPLVTFKDCVSAIDEIKYSPNNRILACGSHDLYIDCYDTGFRDSHGKVVKFPNMNTCWEEDRGGKGEYVHMARCVGHSASVCHLDFSLPLFNPPELRGKTIICSNCNGYEILYWDPLTGEQILQNQRNAKWSTRTTLLGFDVMGIWPGGALTSDLNALDRSKSQEYCVTGDNYSLVKLFNFPVVHDDAPWKEYYGGSSFITCARFSSDDRWVAAVGGDDRTTFLYRTHGVNKDDALIKENRKEVPWCDVDECLYCGREPMVPPPPPPWGPLDDAGKVWGICIPQNGCCTCANHRLHLQQEFLTFDADGNGVVTELELKLVMARTGHPMSDEDLRNLVQKADKDGDGKLKYAEFADFYAAQVKAAQAKKERKQASFRTA